MPDRATGRDQDKVASRPGAAGTLILVVGPSGAGKDTLIGKAKDHFSSGDRVYFPRRFITREEPVGEDHIPVSPSDMKKMVQEERLFLHWQAHGLEYGLPADIQDHLENGKTVVVNVSRRVIRKACDRWSRLCVIYIVASRTVLQERLMNRQREEMISIGKRLERDQALDLPQHMDVQAIDNNHELETAASAFIKAIEAISQPNG